MLAAEKDGMEQLAYSLKLDLEDGIAHGREAAIGEHLETLAQRWPGMDIMVVEPEFTVRYASDDSLLGRRWYEEDIDDVLAGRSDFEWNLKDHSHDGRRAIDVSVGVTSSDGDVLYVVHIAKFLDRLLEAIAKQRRHDLVSALQELAAVAVAVNVLTLVLVLRPLKRVRRKIAESGWLAEHSPSERGDEIEHLDSVVSSLLNEVQSRTEDLHSSLGEREIALQEVSADRDHLVDRVREVRGELEETEARLSRAERIATMAQLSGALAHELRNPLHIIRATAETAASRVPEVEDLTHDIMDEVDRVNRLISELLEYTRPSDLNSQEVDIHEMLEAVRHRMCLGLCEREPDSCTICTIAVDEKAATVHGDPVLLEQAVMNLYTNAREASPDMAVIDVTSAPGRDGEVVLTIADRGPGIAKNDSDDVFEPFFTRKAAGTGLGLPIVQKIADLHHGSIELLPRDGGGTVARLSLPTSDSQGEA